MRSITHISRSLVFAALVLGVVATASDRASAHSQLETSSPADGELVAEEVGSITFEFAAPVEPFDDGFELQTVDGTVEIGSIDQPDDRTVVVTPLEPIREPFAATWAIVSADSHPVTGEILVAVDLPVPAPTSSTTTTTSVAMPPTTMAPEPASAQASTPEPTTSNQPTDDATEPGPEEAMEADWNTEPATAAVAPSGSDSSIPTAVLIIGGLVVVAGAITLLVRRGTARTGSQ